MTAYATYRIGGKYIPLDRIEAVLVGSVWFSLDVWQGRKIEGGYLVLGTSEDSFNRWIKLDAIEAIDVTTEEPDGELEALS